MADTAIEWTGRVWNPVAGCSVLSPGCTNCYAMKMAARLDAMGVPAYAGLTMKTKAGPVWTGEVREVEGAMTKPLHWRKPQEVFVNSMSDLFHEDVPDEWVDLVFQVMWLTPQHTYQILTKRPDRMAAYLARRNSGDPWAEAADRIADLMGETDHPSVLEPMHLPLPNVLLGASVEDQFRAEERRTPMAKIAAAGWATFVSYEPALGPVDWSGWDFLRWLICGGESGPKARPMHPAWAKAARDFCAEFGIPFFFKQWGAWREAVEGDVFNTSRGRAAKPPALIVNPDDGTVHCFLPENENPRLRVMLQVGKKAAGRLLDGVEHNAMPEGRA